MLKKITVLAITIFLAFSSITPTFAQSGDLSDSSSEILREFCDRRQGNVINLEIWYAGKCHPDDDQSTFSGDALGFGDIIILHLYEILKGESNKSDEALIEDIFNSLVELLSEGKSYNYISHLKKLDEKGLSPTSGIAGQIGTGMAFLINNPPATTGQYIASVKENLTKHSIVKPAYAQGSNAAAEGGGYGFARLEGFLPLWRAFRNIAYFFFIIAFVIYGFMIMFRIKINPQTAANIQLALPKLVMTLILITFSYAIVGLLIDFMWVMYYLLINTFVLFGVFGGDTGNGIFAQIIRGDWGLMVAGFFQTVLAVFVGLPAAIDAITGLSSVIFTVILAVPMVWPLTIFIGLILLIAIIIAFIKLFVKLVTAYVTIILQLVLAPLILLTGIIPGKSDAFSSWLTSLTANMVVFPVASILLLFSGFFMVQPVAELIETITPDLPVIGDIASDITISDNTNQLMPNFPLLSPQTEWLSQLPVVGQGISAGPAEWYGLIGLALLLMSPKFVDMVMDAFKVKPFAYGSAIGDTLMGGFLGRQAYQADKDKDTGRMVNALGQAFGQKMNMREKDVRATPPVAAGGPGGGAAGAGGAGGGGPLAGGPGGGP